MIDFQAFLSTLSIMLKGMVGIFIVTGFIILCIKLLAMMDSGKKEN